MINYVSEKEMYLKNEEKRKKMKNIRKMKMKRIIHFYKDGWKKQPMMEENIIIT
jgi:hypothetical protein